jgi:hypothetical protein
VPPPVRVIVKALKGAVIYTRDGTIIPNVPQEVELTPTIATAIQAGDLEQIGHAIIEGLDKPDTGQPAQPPGAPTPRGRRISVSASEEAHAKDS